MLQSLNEKKQSSVERRGEEQGESAAGQGAAKVWEGVCCCSAQGPMVRTWQGGLVSLATAEKEVALWKRRVVRAGWPEPGKWPLVGPENPQIL